MSENWACLTFFSCQESVTLRSATVKATDVRLTCNSCAVSEHVILTAAVFFMHDLGSMPESEASEESCRTLAATTWVLVVFGFDMFLCGRWRVAL